MNNQNEVLIVNEDKFRLNVISLKNKDGIKASIGFEMKKLVYELKAPLTDNFLSNILMDLPKVRICNRSQINVTPSHEKITK